MSIERAQLNFLIQDEFSKKLNNFDIELINFGEFKERSSRTIQNDVLNNFKFTIIKSGECCVYNDQQKIYMKPMECIIFISTENGWLKTKILLDASRPIINQTNAFLKICLLFQK